MDEVSTKFGAKFGHFAGMKLNKLKERVFYAQKAIFSFTTYFKWKCTDTFADLDNILQKVLRDYSLVHNPTV